MGKQPKLSASGKRIGRPPKKGLHVPHNSMNQVTSALAAQNAANNRAGSPEGGVKRKRKSPHKK